MTKRLASNQHKNKLRNIYLTQASCDDEVVANEKHVAVDVDTPRRGMMF